MEKRDQAAVPTIAFESGEWCRAYDTLDNKCSTAAATIMRRHMRRLRAHLRVIKHRCLRLR
jgi:hypothetical protein